MVEYAGYYVSVLVEFLALYGFWLGGGWVFIGVASFPVFALVDSVLPADLEPRRMRSHAWASLPVWICTLLAPVICLGCAWRVGQGGLNGLQIAGAVLVVLSGMIIARCWVECFNYFQHDGLVRVAGLPIAKRHVWNHLGWLTRCMGWDMTNHANHHLDSHLPYYKLTPDTKAISMPNVSVCFLASLVPPLWTNWIAKPALRRWDLEFVPAEERKLARAHNLAAGWPDWFEPTVMAQASRIVQAA